MKDFITMSKYAGMREDLVQAGGGNSAFKISPQRMAIKASGVQLADVTAETGYAIVNPEIIRKAFLGCNNLDAITEEKSKEILAEAYIEGERPSIETFLHSISGRYSLHTHPIVVNALTCRKNGIDEIIGLFPNALVIPYANPGFELAKVYFREYREYIKRHKTDPKYVFLMNHGFLASADTSKEVIRLTEEATTKIEKYLNVDFSAYHEIQAINDLYKGGVTWLATDQNIIAAYKSLNGIWKHYFCPDCVVFLGKKIYETKNNKIDINAFISYVADNGYPSVIIHRHNIYIHADSVKKALEIQSVLSFSAQVMRINQHVECDLLSEEVKSFLLNWDAEKYRKNIK